MTRNKLWVVAGFSLVIFILGGGWLVGIAPQLAIASNAQKDRANVLTLNVANQLLLTKLQKEYQNITPLKDQLDLLTRSVPASANNSSFISELNSLATANDVTIKSITITDAKPYTPSTQVPSGNASQEAPLPQTNSQITSTNFVVIPIQISVTGSYVNVLEFVNGIQMGQRLFLISTLSSAGSIISKGGVSNPSPSKSTSGKVDASIGGYIYVLLQ